MPTATDLARMFKRGNSSLYPDQINALSLFLNQLSRNNSEATMYTTWGALLTLKDGKISYIGPTGGSSILTGPLIVRSVAGRNTGVPYKIKTNNGVKNLLPNQRSLVAKFLNLPESHRSHGVIALSNSSSSRFWGGHVFLNSSSKMVTYQGGATKVLLVPNSLNQARARMKGAGPSALPQNNNMNNNSIPWISVQSTTAAQSLGLSCSYELKGKTLHISEGGDNRTSKVITTRCGLAYPGIEARQQAHNITLRQANITPIVGEIMNAIHFPQSTRHCVFVLPSQLNGAEYTSFSNNTVKHYTLHDYLSDNTGGPRGQLACDPAVAQFILDNACRVGYPKRGINNVRMMGFDHGTTAYGIDFKNGYLLPTVQANVEEFKKMLPNMTIVGTQNVHTNGLDPSKRTRMNRTSRTVDLVYASAAPVKGEYNPGGHTNKTEVGNIVLFGQYVCALRVAIARENCDVILMPLGGGVFKNEMIDIKNAIKLAALSLQDELRGAKVNVKVLAWERSPSEIDTFMN